MRALRKNSDRSGPPTRIRQGPMRHLHLQLIPIRRRRYESSEWRPSNNYSKRTLPGFVESQIELVKYCDSSHSVPNRSLVGFTQIEVWTKLNEYQISSPSNSVGELNETGGKKFRTIYHKPREPRSKRNVIDQYRGRF